MVESLNCPFTREDMSVQGALLVAEQAIKYAMTFKCEPLPGDNVRVWLKDEAHNAEYLERMAKTYPVQEIEGEGD